MESETKLAPDLNRSIAHHDVIFTHGRQEQKERINQVAKKLSSFMFCDVGLLIASRVILCGSAWSNYHHCQP